MYDFANSGYTTVVITAIFNAYFVARGRRQRALGDVRLDAALAVSYAAIVVTAPADRARGPTCARPRSACSGSPRSAASPAPRRSRSPGPRRWCSPCVLVAVSNFFFGTGENVVAAFLPELARGDGAGQGLRLGLEPRLPRRHADPRACASSTSPGAQGAGATAAQFVPGDDADHRGASSRSRACRRSWSCASAPSRRPAAGAAPSSSAFARLRDTARHARRYRDLARFLVCLVFYQAGVQTVIALAAIYAEQAMGFTTRRPSS